MSFPHVVVFVSQRNSFRSVLARACLEHVGKGRFKGYSCGNPIMLSSGPHNVAVQAIQAAGMQLRCDQQYDWNRFSKLGSPKPDFVITMDETIQNITPKWSGQPDTALWAYPDIASTLSIDPGAQKAASIVLMSLRRRLEILVSLPIGRGDRSALRSDVRDLGYLG